MKSKLTASQRLGVIEKILQGDSISKVVNNAGISITILNKWLKRYKEEGEEGLKPKTPGRPRKSYTPKKLGQPKYLSSDERLRMVQEVIEDGKSASDVAKRYGVSRVTLYKWIERFRLAPEKRITAVEDKKREVPHYFRQTPEKYEEVILNLIAQHPEYGVRKILLEVPKIGGRPIIGHHGIQNVLRRHDLSTYEQRLAYAEAQITPVTRVISQILGYATRFFTIPQIPRTRIVRFGSIAAFSMFATVVVFGLGSFLAASYVSAPLSTRIGLVFATLALTFGSIFFLYSLKYYISLAIVLSFSQQEASSGERLAYSKKRSILSWILGLASGGRQGSAWEKKALGLEPNLEHVKLERYPKISVHIPLYNEKNVVERLLSSVTAFGYSGDYEVIIADDSTDDTTTIINSYIKNNCVAPRSPERSRTGGVGWTLTQAEVRPGVVLKHLHRTSRSGFKGGALREALKVTDPKAEFVTVFDADFVPYPDTLELFLKYFQVTAGTLDFKEASRAKRLASSAENSKRFTLNASSSPIAAVQGYQWHVLNKSENWITRGVRSEYAGSYVIERSGAEIYSGIKQISGSVYMIRRDILQEIGWETSITEDFQLTLKLYEKGYKVVYTPYIQAPAECVSTLKRLIRQRMRWAEGHSNNVRRMFTRLLFGHWTDSNVVNPKSQILNSKQYLNSNDPNSKRFEHLDLKNSNLSFDELRMVSGVEPFSASNLDISASSKKKWVPSPLTLSEKLEFLYLSPYYLQAFFFLVGTISWLISEAIFPARLPFWTSLWGWSLVLTNMLSLPLMNAVGLFLEESEERDYLGLASFFAMSYILVPFQAYAAVKGFIQKEEGPWFRTPKTGKITDIFTRGKFYRFVSGILPGRAASSVQGLASSLNQLNAKRYTLSANSLNAYLALATANSRFSSFTLKPKRIRWVGKLMLVFVLTLSLLVHSMAINPTPVEATWYDTGYLYRKKLTIDNTLVSGSANHSNFPVLVSYSDVDLRTTADGGKVENVNGYDIVFTDDDKITKFDHQIEDYTSNATTGTIVMWVRFPTLPYNVDKDIYIYYGNSSISSSQENITGVWDANYKGVWHLKEDPSGSAPQMSDSTSNANHGTSGGTMLTEDQVAGQIGGALEFDGSNDLINLGNSVVFDVANITLSGWAKLDSTVTDSYPKLASKGSPEVFQILWEVDEYRALARVGGTGYNVVGDTVQDTLRYYVMTYDGETVEFFINGVSQGQNTTPSGPMNTNTADLVIANRLTNARHWKGIIDEVRLSNFARTSDWIVTEFNNQNNQGTGTGKFIKTLGTEEQVPEFLVLLLPLALLVPFLVRQLGEKGRFEPIAADLYFRRPFSRKSLSFRRRGGRGP